MPALHGVSRESYTAARARLDELARSGAGDLTTIGDELFAVVALLDAEGTVRRALSDPARSAADRAGFAEGLLSGRVSAATVEVVAALVRERWSSSIDLVDAAEALAAESVVASAERAGRLDEVEDELFRFVRIIEAEPRLRSALSDVGFPLERKIGLLEQLLGTRAAPETLRLARQAALAPRGRTVERLLGDYGQVAADRRNRLVARVTAAAPLTEEQRDRLAGALRRLYGHDVHLDVDVDPDVIGGLRVLVGDEVVDGTITSRLDEARRRLAG